MTKRILSFASLSLFVLTLTACGGSGGSLVPTTAVGSQNPGATRTTSSAVSGAVPTHVQTAEYLWTSTEMATDPATYAPYLTWAYVGKTSLAANTRAAGIKVIVYGNPLMPHGSSYEMNQISSTYSNLRARDCNGNVILTYNNSGNLTDVRNSSAGAYMKNVTDYYVNQYKNANPSDPHPYDAVFIDNANTFWGISAMPCSYSASTWNTNMDAAIQADGYPTIVNTLGTNEANEPNRVAGLQASNIVGGEYEACYNNNHWLAEEMGALSTIAQFKSQGKAPGPGFWCYLDQTSADASTVIPLRTYAYASFLLTYDPNYSVFEESFSTPSTFKVMPETGFVPLNPVKQPTQIDDLKISSGAYVQQYGACYYRGSLVGSCEIAVNPQTYATSIPNSYAHSAVISGAGVLDGGTVTFNGGPVSTLQPHTAAILIGTTATPVPTATATPVPTATATPAGTVTVSGKITSMSTSKTKIQILESNGTSIWVYFALPGVTNATVGEYLTATGTGTNPLNATSYSLSTTAPTPAPTATPVPAPTPYTVTGKIIGMSTSATKLQLQQSNGTSVWVYYTLTTQRNYSGTPAIGEYAKATGTDTSPVNADAVWLSTSPF